MPHWTETPPRDATTTGLPIVRTPAGAPLRGIITSRELIGCDTHYYGGHTVPCERPDCKACNDGVPYRWHGYVALYQPDRLLHMILELTAQATIALVDYRRHHESLRGCQIEAYRWGKRANGRVVLKPTVSAIPLDVLPAEPDLMLLMATIWGLPRHDLTTDPESHIPTILRADSKRNGQSADPRKYSHAQP